MEGNLQQQQNQLKLVCVSDNMKFFVFEGPCFVDKEKKKDKDRKKSTIMGDQKEDAKPAGSGMFS